MNTAVISVDFEILPDAADQRSPEMVFEEFNRNLGDFNSHVRSGPFGFLFEQATVQHDVSQAQTASASGQPTVNSIGQASMSPGGQAPVEMAPPAFGNPITLEPPVAATPLVSIAELQEQLASRDESIQRLTTDLDAQTQRAVAAEGVVSEKIRAMMDVESALEATRKSLAFTQDHLADTRAHLAQAKEMWMKESTRATRLREKLDTAEVALAEKDKALSTLQKQSHEALTENSNLKHLFTRSSDLGPLMEDGGGGGQQAGFTESYFTRPSTASLAPQTTPRFGSNGGLLTAPQLASRASSTANLYSSSRFATQTHLQQPPQSSAALSVSSLGGASQLMSARFNYLCVANDAVLYEDDVLQVGIKASFSGLGEGVVGVYFGNKTNGVLQNFQSRFTQPDASMHMVVSPLPATHIGPKQQICQQVAFQISAAFLESPRGQVSFLLPDNTPQSIPLRLPVTISKFMNGRDLTVDEFFSNWRLQRFHLNECASVVNLSPAVCTLAKVARAAALGSALRLHHAVDEAPENIVLVGQFPSDSPEGLRCATIPESLVLVRLEVGTGAHAGRARLAVRSDDETVALAVRNAIMAQISADHPVS